MGWSESGETRVKRFSVYKDLETKYLEVQRDKEVLTAILERKDATIRQLARELAEAIGHQDRLEEVVEVTGEELQPTEVVSRTEGLSATVSSRPPAAPSRPTPKHSSTTLSKHPSDGLRPTLEQLFAATERAVRSTK